MNYQQFSQRTISVGLVLLFIVGCNTPVATPTDAKTYFDRAYTYAHSRDFDQAIINYTKAIELEPNYAEAYDNRGIAYAVKGNIDKAIADFSKAIEIDPKDALAYNNRGSTYYTLHNYDQAIADYTKAVEIDPTDAQVRWSSKNGHFFKLLSVAAISFHIPLGLHSPGRNDVFCCYKTFQCSLRYPSLLLPSSNSA